jgi:Membrane domain of glycerophosphoryl diester phosphodiesterase
MVICVPRVVFRAHAEESVETVELRPLSLGELLDRTFSLYRNHFWLFVGIMAIPAMFVIPERIVLFNVQGSLMNLTPGRAPTLPSLSLLGGVVAGELAFMVVFITVYSVGMAAATSAVADAYLGRPSTVRGAYAKIRAKFWRLMGVVLNIALRILGFILLPILVVGGGIAGAVFATQGWNTSNPIVVLLVVLIFLFCYIAALALCAWFALRYALAIPVLMIEDLGVLDTIRRSISLTRGRRGQIFLALLVAAIIVYVGLFVFQIPFAIATMLAAIRGHWPVWLSTASGAASAIGIAVAGPISMIVTVLLYYDTRIRKEAFDLQFMMSSLERPAPAAGTVSPA